MDAATQEITASLIQQMVKEVVAPMVRPVMVTPEAEEDVKMQVIRPARGIHSAVVSIVPEKIYLNRGSLLRQRRAIPVIGTVLIIRNARDQE